MKNGKLFVGVLLVIFGILAVVNNLLDLDLFRRIELWPYIIILAGLIFEYSFFQNRKSPGLLVPGGILLTIGILFVFETLTRWHFAEYTWPIYPFAVAVGLFQLYYHGNKDKGLLIPVFILTAVTLISFFSMFVGNIFALINYSLVFPIILIVVGLFVIYKSNVFRK